MREEEEEEKMAEKKTKMKSTMKSLADRRRIQSNGLETTQKTAWICTFCLLSQGLERWREREKGRERERERERERVV